MALHRALLPSASLVAASLVLVAACSGSTSAGSPSRPPPPSPTRALRLILTAPAGASSAAVHGDASVITQRFGLLGMNDTVVKEVGSRKIEVDVSAVDMIGFDAASAAFVATTVGYMEARPVIATVTGTSSKWNSTTPTCSGSAWSSASLAPR